MEKILLRNGPIINGTGAPAFTGNLLIEGTKIAAISTHPIESSPAETKIIDCTNLVIAPGFIDAHNHLDLQLLEDLPSRALQGITSEVVGNCGFSPYPMTDKKQLHDFANGILCGDEHWGWPHAHDYFEAIQHSHTTLNVGSLVGHGSLRIAAAGNKLGQLTNQEQDKMEQLLIEALTNGAVGISTGLQYAPGSSAPFSEVEKLCRIVAQHHKIYTTHMRGYFSNVLESLEEQIELARRTGCRLQISHLQVVGAQNWHLQSRALEIIEAAHDEGIDIAFDCYPYVAGSTVLTQALPQEFLEGGITTLVTKLQNPTKRCHIAAATEAELQWRWSDIYISAVASEKNRVTINQNLADLAEAQAKAPVEVMLDLLVEENGAVNMLCFNQSEENLRATMTHPLSLIISDGFYVNGKPHPRLHGTFPNLLGEFVRERKWLPLETAITKITSLPAERFNFQKRGKLQAGYFADVVVFDPEQIKSSATYSASELEPEGIRHLIRTGKMIAGLS